MTVSINDIKTLFNTMTSCYNELGKAASAGEQEKILSLQTKIQELITQARDLSTILSPNEVKEIAPKLDLIDKQIKAIVEKALGIQNPEVKKLLTLFMQAVQKKQAPQALDLQSQILEKINELRTLLMNPEALSDMEKQIEENIKKLLNKDSDLSFLTPLERDLMKLHEKVNQFKRLYVFKEAEKSQHPFGKELKDFKAKLESSKNKSDPAIKDALQAIDHMIKACSAHMQAHFAMQRALEAKKELPPIGLDNPSCNCWANAMIQVLANADLNIPLVKAYKEVQSKGILCANTLGQQLRESLVFASNNNYEQEDVAYAFNELIPELGLEAQIDQTRIFKNDGTKNVSLQPMPLIGFSLDKNLNFEELLQAAFRHENAEKDENASFLEWRLANIPEHLFFQAGRFNADYSKNETPIKDVPEMLVLPKEYVRGEKEGELYELRACVIQTGGVQSGHYVSAIKNRTGDWYLVNDSVTQSIPKDKVAHYLAQGYIFHYEKVK